MRNPKHKPKALTIAQPFAELICLGIMDCINSTWYTQHRHILYIHAAKKINNSFDPTDAQLLATNHIERFHFITGHIIGQVEVIDCVRNHKSIWAEPDKYQFIFINPVIYPTPIPIKKGSVKLWDFNPNNYNF